MNTDNKQKIDSKPLAIEFARFTLSAIAAASFAAILAMILMQQINEFTNASMKAFCISLPVTLSYSIILNDKARKYHTSSLHRMITLLGLLSFFIGIVSLVASFSIFAATTFSVLSIFMLCIVADSNKRGEKHLSKSSK